MNGTLENFEMNLGPIDTPRKLAEYYIFVSRKTGRTKALIKALPEDGNCIIILTGVDYQKEILTQINTQRPEVHTKNIKFSYSADGKGLYPPIPGDNDLPVFLDNSVIDLAIENIFSYHNRKFNPRW